MSKIICNIEESSCTPSSTPTVTGSYVRCNIDDSSCVPSTPTEGGGGVSAPTYTLSGPASIGEVGSGVFTLTTTGVDEGLLVPYTLTGIQSSDIVSGSLTGTFEINSSGVGSVTIQMIEDFVAENETMTMTIGSQANPLDFINTTIIDTAYALSASPSTSIVEGDSIVFYVSTLGISNGTSLNWDITGSGHSLSATSGTVTINSNSASVTIDSVSSSIYQGTSNFTFRIFDSSGASVADTLAFTVADATATYSQSSASAFDEGTSLAVTVSTTNVQDATTLYWTINHGTTSTADFTAESGSFTVTSNSGSFNVQAVADITTEGAETFSIELRTGSVTGTVVDTSSTITINDTSVASSYTNLSAHRVNNTQSLFNSAGTLYTWGGNDFHINPATAVQNRTIKHAFEGMGYLRTGGNQDYNGYPYSNQSYTWSIWFMYPVIDQNMNNFQNFLMVAKDSTSTIYNYINITCYDRFGNFRINGYVGYNSSGQIAVGNINTNVTQVVAGTWYNLTCVRDASANTHKIFLNGNLEYSDTFNSSSTDPTNVEIDDLYNYGNFVTAAYHGAHITRPTFANTGYYLCIDELSTFNTAIAETGTSSLSVEYIYNNGTPRDLANESGLIGYWRFGDGDDGGSNTDSTTTIYDMSPSGNHITSRDANYPPLVITLSSSDNIYVP